MTGSTISTESLDGVSPAHPSNDHYTVHRYRDSYRITEHANNPQYHTLTHKYLSYYLFVLILPLSI